jgi:L-ascorbate metabolism protein UlaG (beta-lactamase superfamily)
MSVISPVIRALKGLALLLALLLAAAVAWVLVQANRRPSIEAYDALVLPQAGAPSPSAAPGATPTTAPITAPISVRFAGVTTLVFDDSQTAFMIDGFFSRPGFGPMLLTRIAPDEKAIAAGLARLNVQRLAAVVTMHAHYDHALDAPIVARKTGALLIGDASTMNVGKGYGLPPAALREVAAGDAVSLGAWRLTFIASRHAPTPYSDGNGGEFITAPLVPPARASAWREGQAWSLLIEHAGGRSYLVQGSAGFIDGALRGRQADVVFLGVGSIGKASTEYRARLWTEVVRAVQAKRVIAVHWDDFWTGLDQPLRAMPYLTDDLGATLADLQRLAAADGVDLRFAPLFAPFDPGP